MNPPQGWVRIGEIVAPQGMDGEVRVVPLTDFPERFLTTSSVALELPEGPILREVQGARLFGNVAILKLAQDRLEAERLRGVFILVPEEELVPLPQGRYYIYQLLGLAVRTKGGELLGHLEEVLPTGGNDVWVVKGQRGELLLPAIKQVILDVDLKAGEITVELIPGLE